MRLSLIGLLTFLFILFIWSFGTTRVNAYASSIMSGAYQFNENTGTMVEDLTGNGNDGTISGATWTSGKFNEALEFDGVNDYIEFSTTAHDVNTTGNMPFSVSMWVYVPSATSYGWRTLLHQDYQYSLILDSNNAISWADSSDWSYGNFGYYGQVPTDEWVHLAVSKDIWHKVRIFVNGEPVVEKDFGSAITANSNKTFIGCYAGSTACSANYFEGKIDEVKIYNNFALTQSIAMALANKAPLFYQDFDTRYSNGGGVFYADATGHSFEGYTPGGGATWTTGLYDKGFSFDGVNDYVNVQMGSNSHVFGDITAAVWVYIPSAPSYGGQGIISRGNEFSLYLNEDLELSWADSSDWNFANFGYHGEVPTDEWVHLAVTKQGEVVTIYMNGSIVVSKNFGSGIEADSLIGGTIELGDYINAYSSRGSWFEGKMDEFVVYEYALSQYQIQDLAGRLVGLDYFMDSGSGTSAMDSGLRGVDGTIHGATWTTGYNDGGLSFDGINDYIEIPAGDVTLSGDITLMGWFYFDDFTDYVDHTLFHKNENFSLYVKGNGSLTWADSTNWSYASFGDYGTLPEDEWVHIAVVRRDNEVKIYVNGTQIVSKVFGSRRIKSTNATTYLGVYDNYGTLGTYAGVKMDEVRLYDIALTQAEVERIAGL